jgi:3-methyladenine DNA glycosylase/8-oxoguanine DNA glycosylase
VPATRAQLAAAADGIAATDPIMAVLVDTHGPPRFDLHRKGGSRFEQLAESIAYQQLAGKAAAAIWKRVTAAVDPFTPENLLAVGKPALRAAGFSEAKALSVLDLADKVASGVVRLDRIGRLSDADIVRELTVVRGIGPWTAEMFLIFSLGRLDVWPVTDLGVRAGYALAYGLASMPSPAELAPLGDRFHPWRSAAAWYCWRTVVPEA